MKKVLFIMDSYPARQSANVLCDLKIINALRTEKIEIHCLVNQFLGDKREEKVDNIIVHRMNKGLYWKVLNHAKSKTDKLSVGIFKINRVILRAKQLLTIPIYPCYEPINAMRTARNAIKLQKKYSFDIVISEYHGFDSLHAGSKLKKKYPNIVFVPILWDAFTGKEPAKYLPVAYENKKMEKAEERELGLANRIIVMESSRKYHEIHSVNKSYYDKMIYLDIPGITKPLESQKKESTFIKKGKINIVYAGVLTVPDRDPEYIISALEKVSFADRIHMIFICIGNGKQRLETIKDKCPFEITINGYVDKEELLAIYHEADALLNLGGPNPNMVPSKVFEYLSYGKPILSTYYIDNETSNSYLERYPLAICIDQRENIDESTKIIEQKLWPMIGKNVPFDEVQQLFPNNTPEKYKEMIEKLF